MIFIVTLTEIAEFDMYDIHTYIDLHESRKRADSLLASISQSILSLAHMPERGHYPAELDKIRIREFREIHCKPYRIVYAIQGNEVVVHCVLDGRRDMQTLLQQRLLR
ncbi:MAG: type II toxin-antitoxin system RelE/ParE family toxin [Desulfuromonadales bacterium]|nr:type II toxin-antitoxin system RelE/ParE family toxin [Desulfuromonadales bacterium]